MILTHQKGRGTKVHLFLDGEYAATTDENCWLDNYISNGADIDDEQWQALLVKINYKKALNKCADYLSRRPGLREPDPRTVPGRAGRLRSRPRQIPDLPGRGGRAGHRPRDS